MPSLLKAAVLGVLQGLTEFLPVSSTAHLLIASRLIGFDDPGGVFTIMIQLGSILAIMWLYRQKIVHVVATHALCLNSGRPRRHFHIRWFQSLRKIEEPHSPLTDGRAALKLLFRANKRLNTAYLLKESFGQLWDYRRPIWARRFFYQWRQSLRWQRLEPFERFKCH